MRDSSKSQRFETAMMPYLDDAYSLASWMTRDSPESEDLVHDAFLKAFRYFDGFRGGDPRAWLLAIVRNTVLTALQRKSGSRLDQAFDERLHHVDVSSSAEQKLLAEETHSVMRACLDSLPPEYRETILLRELQDLSYKQIAEVSGTPIGTVMSRLARARKRVLDCVQARRGLTLGVGR